MFQVSFHSLAQNLVLFDVIKCVPVATLNASHRLIHSTAKRLLAGNGDPECCVGRSQSDRPSLNGPLSLSSFFPNATSTKRTSITLAKVASLPRPLSHILSPFLAPNIHRKRFCLCIAFFSQCNVSSKWTGTSFILSTAVYAVLARVPMCRTHSVNICEIDSQVL